MLVNGCLTLVDFLVARLQGSIYDFLFVEGGGGVQARVQPEEVQKILKFRSPLQTQESN